MSLRRRLDDIEMLLDQMEPTDIRYNELNEEANQIAEELEAIADQAETRRKQRLAKERLDEVKERIMAKVENNSRFRSFSDWFQWAKSLYPTEDKGDHWVVHSTAKNWSDDNPVYWIVNDEAEAIERIETLVNYKIYDRGRGHGDMELDLASQ